MIKLLRNIRRNLLNEGKTSKYAKYLRYALGEIVLVVIGILIALQINNYNNNQLDRSLRQQYLQGLKSELTMDLGNWNEKKKENKQSIEVMRQVIDEVMDENPRAISSKSSMNLITAMISQPLSSQNSTFTDLISSGKMALITPFELREKIITHYKKIEMYLGHSKREYDYLWEQFHPFFNNNGYYDLKTSK